MTAVLLPWVTDLPFKMQSVLISGLRGPDTHQVVALKRVVRWIRAATQNNADPTTDYMKDIGPLPEWSEVQKELEFCSVHYYAHLMHTLEIIGYMHHDPIGVQHARRLYFEMADALHLVAETRLQLLQRLAR
jgi:hypothetical protein